MKEIAEGILRKMKSRLEQPVSYKIPLGDNEVPLNPLIAKKIKLEYSGNIFCVNCGRKSNKSFNQGYCYPCFQKLADLFYVMWICGGFAPCGPSALLATKKASFGIKTCHLAIPRIMGQRIADFKKKIDFLFFCLSWVKKWCFGSKKRWC